MNTSETTRQRLINRFPDRDEIEVACMIKAAEYVKGVKSKGCCYLQVNQRVEG